MSDLTRLVRPLEWEGDFAHTGLGMFYHIDRRTSGSVPALYRIAGSAQIGLVAGETDEVMRAIAQSDYARRITEALDQDALRALLAEAVKAGLEMGAETANHRWREWGNLAPHEKVECDVTACEDVARSIRALATSPAVEEAAERGLRKGGE